MTTSRRAPSGGAVLRPEVTEAVVEAVLDELAAGGYGRLSMQRVAARAGVGKSALYRRWPGRHEMVMDVVARIGMHDGAPPDTGSLTGDLRELLVEMRAWLTHPRLAQILPDLLAEARRSEDLAAALWDRLAAPRRDWSLAVLERARVRGELADERDVVESDLIADIVGSVPFWRSTVHGADIDDERIERLAAMLARGLGGPVTVPRGSADRAIGLEGVAHPIIVLDPDWIE